MSGAEENFFPRELSGISGQTPSKARRDFSQGFGPLPTFTAPPCKDASISLCAIYLPEPFERLSRNCACSDKDADRVMKDRSIIWSAVNEGDAISFLCLCYVYPSQ